MSDTVERSGGDTDHGSPDPTARTIELRVHGVSGTPPEAMLDEPYPRQVAGDDVGRFFRRSEPISVDGFPDRDVEAYHWGRFTCRLTDPRPVAAPAALRRRQPGALRNAPAGQGGGCR